MTGKTAFYEQHFYHGYTHGFHTADTCDVTQFKANTSCQSVIYQKWFLQEIKAVRWKREVLMLGVDLET